MFDTNPDIASISIPEIIAEQRTSRSIMSVGRVIHESRNGAGLT